METADANFSFFALGGLDELTETRLKDLKVDAHGEPIRKRQQHRKSRHGCPNCKRRKVKCDETQPSCLNCKKRGIECNLPKTTAKPRGRSVEKNLNFPDFQEASLQWPLRPWTRTSTGEHTSNIGDVSDDSPAHTPGSTIPGNVELILRRTPAERELIRHFEMFTSRFLALSPTIWYSEVLTAGLHEDYLMSAVMLVAATHINHQLPKDDPGRRPVLYHFLNALSGLRNALTEPITGSRLDAIISCSILLIHHSWSCIDVTLDNQKDIASLFTESFSLFHGLKDCVMAGYAQHILSTTAWHKTFAHSPRTTLTEYIRIHKPRDCDFLQKVSHSMLCGLKTYDSACSSADNMNALSRLSLVLHAIKLAYPDIEGSGVADDIYRFLLTWPPFCTKGFMDQVKENNPASLLILLYYYAAIVSVFSGKLWWMRDRALLMYTKLRGMLEGRCEECTGPAIALCGDIGAKMMSSSCI
ncbi:hypothetical protein EG329_002245 [Mollisiaceae sp. DMI_Dod_QoI]|nr:hypothetical protein EG329_002245 [Helotiales sp. DMI_Dod_QoI]